MLRLVPSTKNQSPPVSPSLVAPFTRAGGVCEAVCACAAPRAPLTGLNRGGEGAVSAGYLAPSANPSALASGGAVSKPGPDSGKEWMPPIKQMINESFGCKVLMPIIEVSDAYSCKVAYQVLYG